MRPTRAPDPRQTRVLREALRLLVARCPILARECYWAGTACIAIEELHHRQSFDLDFHTRKALRDVRPLLTRLQAACGRAFELIQAPDEFGGGFRGVLKLPSGERITVEVLSNYQDVADEELTVCRTVTGLKRVSLARYLADKIQCLAERSEARDLVDVWAVLRRRPTMRKLARRLLAQQDEALLAERLLSWSDRAIEQDLESYPDADPANAAKARRTLLGWLRERATG